MSCSKIKDSNQKWPEWAKGAAEELFPIWNKQLSTWKDLHVSNDHGIARSYVGFILFGYPEGIDDGESMENFPEMWLRYPGKEKNIIETIIGKFEYNDKHRCKINHTYLYIDDHTIQCVFRQKLPNGDVNFIDVTGRVYRSWVHFCDTNKSPSCQFLAPKDGIHKADQILRIYKTSGEGLFFGIMKYVAVGCTCVAIFLAITGLGFAVAFGGISALCGMGFSIDTLIDRYKHKQSIGFDNAESTACWLTIATAGLNGVTSLALNNAAQIVNMAGIWGKNALITLSLTTLGTSLVTCGFHMYHLRQKVRRGENVLLDCLGLCVNIFLTCGAVYNTIDMYNFISSLEIQSHPCVQHSSNSSNLSANANTDEVVVSQQIMPKGLKFVLNIAEELVFKFSDQFSQQVLYQCITMGTFYKEFKKGKIDVKTFASNVAHSLENLYTLMKRPHSPQVQAAIKTCLGNVPNEVTYQLSQNLTKAKTDVQNVQMPSFSEPRPESRDDIIEHFMHRKFVFVIQQARNRILQETPPNDFLSAFSIQLERVIDEILSKTDRNYEEFITGNIELAGNPESADEFFSQFGITSKREFANDNFPKVMKELKEQARLVVHSAEIERIAEKLFALFEEIFENDLQLGILETCEVLRKSSNQVLLPLQKTFNFCFNVFELNSKHLPKKRALLAVTTMLKAKQSNESDDTSNPLSSIFFDIAREKLDLDEIICTLWAITSKEKKTNAQPTNTLSDDKISSTLLSLCKDFFQKVESNKSMAIPKEEYYERLKHSYDFLVKNFISLYQARSQEKNSGLQKFVELNELFFDQHGTLHRKFRAVCVSNNYEVFVSVEKHFRDKNNLKSLAEKYVSEYKNIDDVCTEICKNEMVELYSIYKGNLSNLEDYKRKAAKLFNLNENEIEHVVMENEIVMLKCDDFYFTFHSFGTESMYVMKIDGQSESKLPVP